MRALSSRRLSHRGGLGGGGQVDQLRSALKPLPLVAGRWPKDRSTPPGATGKGEGGKACATSRSREQASCAAGRRKSCDLGGGRHHCEQAAPAIHRERADCTEAAPQARPATPPREAMDGAVCRTPRIPSRHRRPPRGIHGLAHSGPAGPRSPHPAKGRSKNNRRPGSPTSQTKIVASSIAIPPGVMRRRAPFPFPAVQGTATNTQLQGSSAGAHRCCAQAADKALAVDRDRGGRHKAAEAAVSSRYSPCARREGKRQCAHPIRLPGRGLNRLWPPRSRRPALSTMDHAAVAPAREDGSGGHGVPSTKSSTMVTEMSTSSTSASGNRHVHALAERLALTDDLHLLEPDHAGGQRWRDRGRHSGSARRKATPCRHCRHGSDEGTCAWQR